MTETPTTTPAPPSQITQALAQGKLGSAAISFYTFSSMGPELVVAGVVTTAYAVTGLTGVPIAFAITALVLLAFSVGYIAMARRIPNAGAFYAFVTQGLGRPFGIAAAFLALIGYNALQAALYGLLGYQLAGYLTTNAGWNFTWWECGVAAWVVVTALGQARVDVSGRILGILSCLEIAVIAALAVKGLTSPAGGHVSFTALNPTHLTAAGIGPLLAIAVLGYIGFEQAPVYSEEARDPKRTVTRATVFCLVLVAIVYTLASWSLTVHYGAATVSTASSEGPGMLFALAPGLLGSTGNTLFLTSLAAAALAYHNAVWRYTYAIARDGLLPSSLARVGAAGIPRAASALQGLVGIGSLFAAKILNWSPVNQYFYIGGTWGGYAILILLTLTALAVIVYLYRFPQGESAWVRLVLPVVSAIGLLVMAWLCTAHFALLLGVAPSDPTTTRLIGILAGAVVLGLVWSLYLKFRRPAIYAALARGPQLTTPEDTR